MVTAPLLPSQCSLAAIASKLWGVGKHIRLTIAR
jgi:hypothetical protein